MKKELEPIFTLLEWTIYLSVPLLLVSGTLMLTSGSLWPLLILAVPLAFAVTLVLAVNDCFREES